MAEEFPVAGTRTLGVLAASLGAAARIARLTLRFGTVVIARSPNEKDRSLARAGWVIARLGGWNCCGKPPGPITMRRGLERFHAIDRGHSLTVISNQM